MGESTELTQVLALDCEMVGTGPRGSVSALARVCVVNAQGNVVMDTFVKPNEKVTDYRTWVSGVRPQDVANGRPFDEVIQEVGSMVKGRILVGHSIRNDLRALRLEEHPRELLRDTAKYPALMKVLDSGKKVSASLKELAASHLGLTIQEGEHTPVDDARAALYLYLKHRREWEAAAKAGLITAEAPSADKKKTGAKARAGAKGRGAAAGRGSGMDKGSKQLGVKGGRVQKRKGAAGKGLKDQARGGSSGGKGKGAGPKPIWSLATDVYADL